LGARRALGPQLGPQPLQSRLARRKIRTGSLAHHRMKKAGQILFWLLILHIFISG
jgi:hypothetical protein